MTETLDRTHSDLLTTDEAANFLRVESRTLANWRALRRGPAYVKIGARCVRYRRDELARFIEQGPRND